MVSLRARNRFLRSMDSTKRKLHVAPNNSAVSLTFGARTNRVITRTIQNHSSAESTAFSCSTTEGVGGFCQSIGNTKQRRIRSQENFFNAEPSVGADDCGSVAPAMDVHRGSIRARSDYKMLPRCTSIAGAT